MVLSHIIALSGGEGGGLDTWVPTLRAACRSICRERRTKADSALGGHGHPADDGREEATERESADLLRPHLEGTR